MQHASLNADAAGHIRDVPRLIATYAALRGISERAAWKALRAALDAGWLRCTQKAAPGQRAGYQLQLPIELVPNALPEDLARALHLWDDAALPEPDHADTHIGHLTAVPPPVTTPEQDAAGGKVQTLPLYAKAKSLLWSSTCTTPGAIIPPPTAPPRGAARREPLRREELAAARQVLARCEPWWTQQRGVGRGALSAAEAEALAGPVAYALRRTTPTAVVELITVRTRSARSLPHVVGARLWRLIRNHPEHHRRPELPADETGQRYHHMLTRRADHQDAVTARTTDLRTELRDQTSRKALELRLARTATDSAPRHRWAREDATTGHQALQQAALQHYSTPLEIYRAAVQRSRRQRRQP